MGRSLDAQKVREVDGIKCPFKLVEAAALQVASEQQRTMRRTNESDRPQFPFPQPTYTTTSSSADILSHTHPDSPLAKPFGEIRYQELHHVDSP